MEDRTECRESGAVSYKRDVANVLALEIDPAAATNKEELGEYQVPFMVPATSNRLSDILMLAVAAASMSAIPVLGVCVIWKVPGCLWCLLTAGLGSARKGNI